MSSCDPCECGDPSSIGFDFTDVEMRNIRLSDRLIMEDYDSIYFDQYAIQSNFTTEQSLSFQKTTKQSGSFIRFSSLYACSCVLDQLYAKDPIKFVKIRSWDEDINSFKNVSDHFDLTNSYFSAPYSFSYYYTAISDFNFGLRMNSDDNIPSTTYFEVIVTLESGQELISTTNWVTFL